MVDIQLLTEALFLCDKLNELRWNAAAKKLDDLYYRLENLERKAIDRYERRHSKYHGG